MFPDEIICGKENDNQWWNNTEELFHQFLSCNFFSWEFEMLFEYFFTYVTLFNMCKLFNMWTLFNICTFKDVHFLTSTVYIRYSSTWNHMAIQWKNNIYIYFGQLFLYRLFHFKIKWTASSYSEVWWLWNINLIQQNTREISHSWFPFLLIYIINKHTINDWANMWMWVRKIW